MPRRCCGGGQNRKSPDPFLPTVSAERGEPAAGGLLRIGAVSTHAQRHYAFRCAHLQSKRRPESGVPMLRALKRLLSWRAAMPEYVSETREGMDNIADAIRTLAGVMASVAATAHTDTLGNQRNMAGVIYADAQERFGDVLKKLDAKSRKDLESWLAGLCKSKK